MAIELILDGDNKSAIKDLHDLEIFATIEKGNVSAKITTSQIVFVGDYAKLIRAYIAGGATGQTTGIFEGLPLQMLVNGVNVFDGYLDFLNDFEIVDPTTVKARIKKHDSNNNFQNRSSGLTFGYLDEINFIGINDYIDIPYIIEKEFNFMEFAFLAFSIYTVTRDLEGLLKEIPTLAADVVAHVTGGITGSAAAIIFSVARLAINIIFTALMLILLANLALQLLRYIISPVKFHKGIRVLKLIEKGCQFLGLQYNTTINDIPDLVILPSKTGIGQDIQENKIIQGIVINQPGVGYPSTKDFGYTLNELIQLMDMVFFAEHTIRNGVLEQHTIDTPWWTQNSTYVLPEVLHESIIYNANELESDKIIVFKSDSKDSNSLENLKGHLFEIKTRPDSINDSRNILMDGAERIDIPYELGNRKDSLNNREKLAIKLYGKIDDMINFFGGNSNLVAAVNGRIGNLKLETDFINVPKLMKMDGLNKLPANNRTVWSAKYLYDIYHSKGSFLLNNFGGQYRLFKNVKVNFGFDDFIKLIDNSYFSDADGNDCKLEKAKWIDGKDFALISYRIKEKYTDNIKEIYIEQE